MWIETIIGYTLRLPSPFYIPYYGRPSGRFFYCKKNKPLTISGQGLCKPVKTMTNLQHKIDLTLYYQTIQVLSITYHTVQRDH